MARRCDKIKHLPSLVKGVKCAFLEALRIYQIDCKKIVKILYAISFGWKKYANIGHDSNVLFYTFSYSYFNSTAL